MGGGVATRPTGAKNKRQAVGHSGDQDDGLNSEGEIERWEVVWPHGLRVRRTKGKLSDILETKTMGSIVKARLSDGRWCGHTAYGCEEQKASCRTFWRPRR